jgi:hypothetical protein
MDNKDVGAKKPVTAAGEEKIDGVERMTELYTSRIHRLAEI